MKKLAKSSSLLVVSFLFFISTYGQHSEMRDSSLTPILTADINAVNSYEPIDVTPSFWQKVGASLDTAEFKLKINAAYLAATVANIGVEFKVGRQLSIDLPLLYSPYNLSPTKKLKVLVLQPELRYWIKQQYADHFVGAHIHLAWYNTAGIFANKDIRYQDSKNKPLWGLGLSYGYAISLGNDFGVEFTMGLGYARLCYNTYYNINNGSLIESGLKKDYWGITRLGVTFSYKL